MITPHTRPINRICNEHGCQKLAMVDVIYESNLGGYCTLHANEKVKSIKESQEDEIKRTQEYLSALRFPGSHPVAYSYR